jgi:uncharacterized protein (DUF2132 family)
MVDIPLREHPNDPLFGVSLKSILEFLVDTYGWGALGEQIRINCFTDDPSIKSSLTFLRRTPWARQKVEELYIETKRRDTLRTSS